MFYRNILRVEFTADFIRVPQARLVFFADGVK